MTSTSSLQILAIRLGEALLAQGLKVTTAESCTGGGIARAITCPPGSSQWFELGYIAYANQAKQNLLQVPESLLESCGAVSREVVEAMARGALTGSGADLAVAVSGIAGPDGGSAEKPVGTVWFNWCKQGSTPLSRCYHFSGDREAVRSAAVYAGLEGLLGILEQ